MATRYEMRTFGDLIDAIMEQAKYQSSDTINKNRIRRNLNTVYLDEVVPYKQWSWTRGSANLQAKPYFSTGTASVTAGSGNVTLTELPAVSYKGYLFSADGSNEIYRIVSHSAGSAAIILDVPFASPTSATSTFKIWSDALVLPSDVEEVIELTHPFSNQPVKNMGLQEFRRAVVTQPKSEGRPYVYTTTDWKDPEPYAAISGLPASATRASSQLVKTIVFASSLGATETLSYLRPGDRIQISSAGSFSYNIEAVVSSLTTTNNANDTISYTSQINLNESAVADTGIVIKKLSSEGYERYREILMFPSLYNAATTMHLDYIKSVGPMESDSDEPLLPIKDRIVLFYGAMALTFNREKNPEDVAYWEAKYNAKLNRMAGKTEDSPDKPRFIPSTLYMNAKRSNSRSRFLPGGSSEGFGGGSSRGVTGTPNQVAVFNSNGDLVSSSTITTTELANVELLNAGTAYRVLVSDATGVFNRNVALTAGKVVYVDPNGLLLSSTVDESSLAVLTGGIGLTSVSLADNQAAAADVVTFAVASYTAVQLNYSLKRGTSYETGLITLTTDGSAASVSQGGVASIGTMGVVFTADVSGGNLRLRYTSTSTGTAPTFKYLGYRWLA